MPLDPIWVRFQLSEAELPTYQRLDRQSLPIQLILTDDTVLPQHGRIENTLNGVNTRTGTMEVQARFPNPDRTIQSGQFARVRLRLAARKNAILVPQKVVQELQGLHSVLTVDAENKVQVRSIVTADRVDDRWVVEQGLKPGEMVIVDGLQKARPGALVTPTPYTSASAQSVTADRPTDKSER